MERNRLDERVVKELVEKYGFTKQEIEQHKNLIREMFLTQVLTLKYTLIDATDGFVKGIKSLFKRIKR